VPIRTRLGRHQQTRGLITIKPRPIEQRLTHQGLQLGPLTVSFQRFQRPSGGIIREAPPSLGALPVGEGQRGEWLLPVAEDEAFWIGVNADRAVQLAVKVETQSRGALDALSGRTWNKRAPQTISLASFAIIAGIRLDDGTLWAFARAPSGDAAPACAAMRFFARNRCLQNLAGVRLVNYISFAKHTGREPPVAIDPNAGYKGFRLP
jgi:hypothetical protein